VEAIYKHLLILSPSSYRVKEKPSNPIELAQFIKNSIIVLIKAMREFIGGN
jgi:hypothetical protein